MTSSKGQFLHILEDSESMLRKSKHVSWKENYITARVGVYFENQTSDTSLHEQSETIFVPYLEYPICRSQSLYHMKSLEKTVYDKQLNFRDQRNEFRTIENHLSKSRKKIIDLHSKVFLKMVFIEKLQSQLRRLVKGLSKLVRLKTIKVERAANCISLIGNQKKRLLDNMEEFKWRKKNYFHMYSLEHFNGNKRAKHFNKHAISNLAIIAVANRSVKQQRKTMYNYEKCSVNIKLLNDRISAVSGYILTFEDRRFEYERFIGVLKSQICVKFKKMLSKTESSIRGLFNQAKELFPFQKYLCKSYSSIDKEIENILSEENNGSWQNLDIQEFVKGVDQFLEECRNLLRTKADLYVTNLNDNTKSLSNRKRTGTLAKSTNSIGIGGTFSVPTDSVLHDKVITEKSFICPRALKNPSLDYSSTCMTVNENIVKIKINGRWMVQNEVTCYNVDYSLLTKLLENLACARMEHNAWSARFTNLSS